MPMAGQQGPPPELLQALLGGGGAPPMGAPAEPEDDGVEQGSFEEHVQQMLMHARAAMDARDADNQERAQVSRAITLLRTLLGSREKESDAMLGTSPQHRAMRRSYA